MKRIGSWLFIIVLVLGLCACGQEAGATWQEQYDLGIKYLSGGNYKEAIIAFTAAIDIDAKRPEAFIGRGDAYALSGDTEDNLSAAQADYEEAIALDETMPGGWLGLADVYIRLGDYAKAMEILREALEKTGNHQSISDKLAEMENGSFYDSAGNLRRMNSYDGNGDLSWYHIYTYDSKGRQTAVTEYDASGISIGKVEMAYDEDGNQTIGFAWDSTGAVMPVAYTYDDKGNVVRAVHYSQNGEVLGISESEYDENGNVIRENMYSPEGELYQYAVKEYDANNNIVQNTEYMADGTMASYSAYEYNAQGQIVKSSTYAVYEGMEQLDYYAIWLYGEQGNYLGQEIYDANDNLIQSNVNEG